MENKVYGITRGTFVPWPRFVGQRPHEVHSADEVEIPFTTPEERGDSQEYPDKVACYACEMHWHAQPVREVREVPRGLFYDH